MVGARGQKLRIEDECGHNGRESDDTCVNLLGLNLLDSLNDVSTPQNRSKSLGEPWPASTCASMGSSQTSPGSTVSGSRRSSGSTVSEGIRTDWLRNNSLNQSRELGNPSPAYGSFNDTFVEWVESPIHPQSKMAQTQANQKKDWVESPIHPHSKVAQSQADQKKEWVESPIHRHSQLALSQADQNKDRFQHQFRTHGNLAPSQSEWNKQDRRQNSNEGFGQMPGFGMPAQETPLPHFKAVPNPSHQPFVNVEVQNGASAPCAAQTLPPASLKLGIGMAEHAQQQNVTWFCVAWEGGPGAVLRYAPHYEAQCTGGTLRKNEVFSVDQEMIGPDGRIYLHLADGRGWAFEDSMLAPQDPSIVRMDFAPVSNPSSFCHSTSTSQHVQQPTNAQQPELRCVSCNYQIDVRAKFCIICGAKQQPPPGIASYHSYGSEPWVPFQSHPPVPFKLPPSR